MRTIIQIFFLFIFLFSASLSTWAKCINCSADVTLPYIKAKDFKDILLTISSMPLSGQIIQKTNQMVIIRVETDESYAKANHINSFNLANFLVKCFLDKGENDSPSTSRWGIKKIEAQFATSDNEQIVNNDVSMSNVGSIGHQ